jgi:hypothetical protein
MLVGVEPQHVQYMEFHMVKEPQVLMVVVPVLQVMVQVVLVQQTEAAVVVPVVLQDSVVVVLTQAALVVQAL